MVFATINDKKLLRLVNEEKMTQTAAARKTGILSPGEGKDRAADRSRLVHTIMEAFHLDILSIWQPKRLAKA